VYFVTQNPLDVPDSVLAQLGNRVQHALRAFTPRDQKAVKSAAETMRPNPKLDIGAAITDLAVGEALVSFLDDKGRPSVTERVFVRPPTSQIGPITAEQRKTLLAESIVAGVYEKMVDRESAYEKIKGRTDERMGEAPQNTAASTPNTPPPVGAGVDMSGNFSATAPATRTNTTMGAGISYGRQTAPAAPAAPEGTSTGGAILSGLNDLLFGTTGPRGGKHDGLAQSMARSAVRTIGTSVGKEILRGVLGGIFGKGK
jgi:hypothetical protein